MSLQRENQRKILHYFTPFFNLQCFGVVATPRILVLDTSTAVSTPLGLRQEFDENSGFSTCTQQTAHAHGTRQSLISLVPWKVIIGAVHD